MRRFSVTWKVLPIALVLGATFALVSLLVSVPSLAQTPPPTPVNTPSVDGSVLPQDGTPEPGAAQSAADDVAAAVTSRTPIPTPTAGVVQQGVNQFTRNAGLANTTVLGLSADDWINIGISALVFLLLYWLLVRLLNRLLRRLVHRTGTKADDQVLNSIDQELVWLMGLFLLRYSIFRLDFLSNGMRTLINDVFFVIALVVSARMALKLLNFGLSWYEGHLDSAKDKSEPDAALMMLKHAGRLLIYLTGISIGLSHFGLANNAISIVLFAVGIVILLSIKDVITDIIYGFIILVGKPFREGDAIHIPSMQEGDWAWVSQIGSRDTHIRTRDNRILVVPNATMGTNQVTNYTFPDPSYRVYTDLHFAYGTDFDQIQTLLEQAVRGVDKVLANKPVDVIFLQFGPSTRHCARSLVDRFLRIRCRDHRQRKRSA